MKKTLPLLIALLVLALSATSVFAGTGYPWRNHAAPYDFTFGNHIDAHQQTKQVGKDKLGGFFYIRFMGESTADGVPIAMHGDCEKESDCSVGWKLHGIQASATLCAKEHDKHPTWVVDPDDLPKQPGYTHFHWLNASEHGHELKEGYYEGYILKLTAVDHFYFKHHGGFNITPGIDYQSHANIVSSCN